MAKHTSPMRLNERLVSEAQVVSTALNRSTAEQIEYWSELGKRVSADMTPAEVIQIMTGTAKVVVEKQEHEPLDVLSLAEEVEADSQSGALYETLLSAGQTLYSPAEEGGGLLIAHFPDGTTAKGKFVDGQFKKVRKQPVAERT